MCWSHELCLLFILRRQLHIYALGKTHMRSTPLDILVLCFSISCVIARVRRRTLFKIASSSLCVSGNAGEPSERRGERVWDFSERIDIILNGTELNVFIRAIYVLIC